MTSFARALRGLAFVPAIFAAVAPASAQDAVKPYWTVIRLFPRNEEQSGLMRRALPIGNTDAWISAADFPADQPTGDVSRFLELRVSIDASGTITQCMAVPERGLPAYFGSWACEMVRKRGTFRHALSAEGQPVADTIIIGVHFGLSSNPFPPVPPAPPPPPAGWRPTYRPEIRMVSAPDPAAQQDPTITGSTIVDVWLSKNRDGAIRANCSTARSSGDARVDKASCAFAASAGYAFIEPGRSFGSMQLRVHWKKGRARFDTPKRDQGTPAELRFDPAITAPAELAFTETGYFALTIHPGGRVDCRVLRTTGSDALDLRSCQAAARAHARPETNIFGEEVSARIVYRLSPEDRIFQPAR